MDNLKNALQAARLSWKPGDAKLAESRSALAENPKNPRPIAPVAGCFASCQYACLVLAVGE